VNAVFWIALAYLSGALPFSVWVGKLALRTDIRGYGDHNPGAFNVFRAGGKGWGVIAILLDGFKGAIPIWLAVAWGGVEGWVLAAVAIAPVLGHAYSPLLGFRGGKALAVTFGIWCGLTLWFGPTVLGIALAIGLALFRKPGWAVIFGMAALLAGLLLVRPELNLLAVWAANTAILVWKHRGELGRGEEGE
jgi:glycerol-3-phosphate acyltransferase PlsY